VCLGAAAPTSAEWLVMPFAGMTFAARGQFVDLEGALDGSRAVIGAGAGWRRSWLIAGAEVGWSPNFLNTSDDLISRGRVTSIMGDVAFALPRLRTAKVEPYVGVGAGIVRVDLRDVYGIFTRTTNLGTGSVSFGALVRLRPRLTVRGDVRYFRTEQQEEGAALGTDDLRFWRVTGGLVFSFGG
jgi:hypothetical protein